MEGKIILGIFAHPDDLEFGAAGTIAKWAGQGAQIYYLVLTDGSKGSEDTIVTSEELKKIRQAEQKSAAKILGVKEVFFLDYIDGELINSLDLCQKIVRVIRQVKPNIVIMIDPSFLFDARHNFINHPDHRAAGQAALDSVFPFARNSRTFPELIKEGLFPHKVQEIILMNLQNPNFFVDISETMDIKLKALAQHKSQPDAKDMEKFLKEANRKLGEKINTQFAEGFLKIKLPE